MAQKSLSEQFFQGIGNAVADVREKFEEFYFGRAVTSDHAQQLPEGEQQPPFGSLTHRIDGWPERSPAGLTGEALGPEVEAQRAPSSDKLLEHGHVIDQEPAHWPEASHAQRIEQEREQNRDRDMDR